MSDLPTSPGTRRTDALGVVLLLFLILVAGAYLRLVGLDWDEGHLLHPDERFLSWVTSDMRSVDTVAEYFDTTRSTLNPNNVGHGFYAYGHFPIIVARYLGEWLGRVEMYSIYPLGRVLSAGADLLTLVLLFFVGSRLFDRRIGLLAAALYAAAAFPIQQSHFYTVDVFANLFVVGSFFFAARVMKRHSWLDYPFFGLMLGLGMASKASVFPMMLILMVALALRTSREIQGLPSGQELQHGASAEEDPGRSRRWWQTPAGRRIMRSVIAFFVAGVVTLLVFRIAQPYAFLPAHSDQPIESDQLGPLMTLVSYAGDPIGMRPNPAWLAQMQEVRRLVSGQADIPPNHQWGKRLPLIFPWLNIVRVGLGWPLGVWCWLAFAWALWEIGREHRGSFQLVLPVTWVALFFAWHGVGWVKTMRYFLPLYPFLVLLGAWALITMWDRVLALIAARHAPRWHWSAKIVAGLMAAILISAYGWGFAVSRIYTRPVTRVAASRWILENVPSDVTLILDTVDGPHQFQLGLPDDWPSFGELLDGDPTQPSVRSTQLEPGFSETFPFSLDKGGTLSRMRFTHVADPDGDGELRVLAVKLASDPIGKQVLVETAITSSFAVGQDPRGEAYYADFGSVELVAGQTYYLVLQADEHGPLILSSSSIATEGEWDDPVPLSLAPYNVWGSQFQGYQLQMFWEDTADKQARMQYVLDHADYLTLSSNRFYASLPRNPQRYPLSIAYYRALFSGELGFELVGDFASRPNIGPIEFCDDTAEEAWTVYDHPRVLIFRKTADYDPRRTAEILNSVNLDEVVRVIAKDAKGWPVTIRTPEMPVVGGLARGLGVTGLSDDQSFDPARRDIWSIFQPLTVIVWWLLMLVVGWIAFPALYVALPGLPDRGYPLSKIFGLIFSAWSAWMLASLKIAPWSGWVALLALLALAALSAALILPRRDEFLGWLTAYRDHLFLIEVLTGLLFVVFVLIRLGNPDLWHPAFGGEKPMDLAYFNAVLRSQTFPPYDPWFAGGMINYYYFGFVIVGLPLKLLGIPVTLAYNLILPTLFALTGAGAFSAAFNLIAPHGRPSQTLPSARDDGGAGSPTLWAVLRAWPQTSPSEVLEALRRHTLSVTQRTFGWQPYAAGLAALVLIAVLGNLDQIRTALWGLAELGSGIPEYASRALPSFGDVIRGIAIQLTQDSYLPVGLGEWYWNATRVIPVPISDGGIPYEIGPITEFPLFTFLYADLHAHMIAMPISLLVVGWCIAQIRGARREARAGAISGARPVKMVLLNFLVGALAIGTLFTTNTWDWPTYLVLGIGAVALAHVHRRQDRVALLALVVGVILAALLGGGTYLFATSPGLAADPDFGQGLLIASLCAGLCGLLAGYALGVALARPRPEQVGGEHPNTDHESRGHWLTLLGVFLQTGILAGGSLLLYLPYLMNYKLGYTGFIPWTGSRTPLWAYLDILGLFLFLIISWMSWESWVWLCHVRKQGKPFSRAMVLPTLVGLAAYGGLIALLASNGYAVALIVLPLLLWALILFFRPDQAIEKRAMLAILSLALVLTFCVEIVVLVGDLSRMNTVFKFYMQVWILMGIVAGAAMGWLWLPLSRAARRVYVPWMSVLAGLVFLASLYPLLATRAKVADRWTPNAPHTLDGMLYMRYAERYENGVVFSLEPDYKMLRWLQDNISGNPVILEAQSIEYLWGSRVSVYTGLPSVIGWNWHQRQQRPLQSDEVWMRVGDVQIIYNTPDINYARSLLSHYHVDLIVVGELERAYYDAGSLRKFELMADFGYLEAIYRQDNTVIYRVVKD